MNIDEVFPDGKWIDEDEYLIRCPVCDDHPTHDHCYVNPLKDKFCCHYSGCSGSASWLVRRYAEVELEPRKGIVKKKEYEPIDFSKFSRAVHEEGTLGKLAYAYLRDRGLVKEEMWRYNIRLSHSGKFYGRVLIPIYENGRVACLVARSFMNMKPKYLYPHTGETVMTVNEAIFGYEEALRQSRGIYVLVEGVFDAIRINKRIVDLGIRGLAILSKHLSKGQFNKLLKLKGASFLVMMDSDAHEDSMDIAKMLAGYGRDVRVCLLPKGDPDSLSDSELEEAIDMSEKFSLNLQLRFNLRE